MDTKYFKLASFVVALSMLISMLGACGKGVDESGSATGRSIKTEIAGITTAKTTVKLSATNTKSTASSILSASMPAVVSQMSDISYETTAADEMQVSGEEGLEASSGALDIENINFNIEEKVTEKLSYDLGGTTIVYATNVATNIWADTEDTRVEYRTVYKRVMEAAEKFNFKFETKLTLGNLYYTEIINNTLAGVKYADIIQQYSAQAYPAYVNNNIMVATDEYLDYELPVMKANPVQYYATNWKGRHYGFTCLYEYGNADILLNRPVLAREGQPDVLDMVEAGTWTWDVFLQIAINCTKDLNGDGIIDQWGLILPGNTRFMQELMYSNGVFPLEVEGDKVVFKLDSPPAMRALQFASDLVYIHKVTKNDNATTVKTYVAGKGAMAIVNFMNNRPILAVGVDSGIAPLPKGPDVGVYQNRMVAAGVFSVLTTCLYPKEVTQIFTEACLLWDENLKPIPAYQEVLDVYGYDWLWNPLNPIRRISTEREFELCYEMLYPLLRVEVTTGYPDLTNILNNNVYTNILTGTMSVAQAVAAVKSQILDIIESN